CDYLIVASGRWQMTNDRRLPGLYSPLATRHSSLVTRHSPLATRHSPLATRHSPLATIPSIFFCFCPLGSLRNESVFSIQSKRLNIQTQQLTTSESMGRPAR